MNDEQPMQASGQDGRQGAPDGVEDPNGADQGGGQSEGGAYPNPYGGKTAKEGGFFGHGGQVDIDYSGTGGEGDRGAGNPNSVTGG